MGRAGWEKNFLQVCYLSATSSIKRHVRGSSEFWGGFKTHHPPQKTSHTKSFAALVKLLVISVLLQSSVRSHFCCQLQATRSFLATSISLEGRGQTWRDLRQFLLCGDPGGSTGSILAASQNMYFCVGFGRVVSQFSRIWAFGWGLFFSFGKLFYGHFYKGCKVQCGFLCNSFSFANVPLLWSNNWWGRVGKLPRRQNKI